MNLVVDGRGIAWRPLIEHLAAAVPDLARIDLENPATASLDGLVTEIMRACGVHGSVADGPEALVALGEFLNQRPVTRLALLHYDHAARRDYSDLVVALRYHLMETQKLVLLIQSRRPFHGLIAPDYPVSPIDLVTVELRSRA